MMEFFDGINHPSSAQVRAAGCSGCLMYCGTPGDSLRKDFTAAQYADYRANGIVRILVYENLANDIAGGASGGAAHAAAFLADARSKGVDVRDPAVATVDEHVAAANLPLAVAYQSGFYHALKANGWLGPVGVYGFSEVLIACHAAGVADWYWGAGARSAMPPWVNVWQDNTGVINVGGSADDRDWILIPLPGGTDMAVTDPLPVKRPDGSVPTVGDALGALYVGDFYGGESTGGVSLYAKIDAMQAQLDTIVAALAALSKPTPTPSPVTGTYTVSPITLTGPIPAVATLMPGAAPLPQVVTTTHTISASAPTT